MQGKSLVRMHLSSRRTHGSSSCFGLHISHLQRDCRHRFPLLCTASGVHACARLWACVCVWWCWRRKGCAWLYVCATMYVRSYYGRLLIQVRAVLPGCVGPSAHKSLDTCVSSLNGWIRQKVTRRRRKEQREHVLRMRTVGRPMHQNGAPLRRFGT